MIHCPIARRAAVWLCGLLGTLAIAGCAQTRPATVPMHTLSDRLGCAASPTTLVVMLPGAYSLPDEFVREGFVAALRARSLAVDVLIVDSHLGYVADGSVLRRLHEDVVLPARAAGYRSLWMVGISLGGFVALNYAAAHGEGADGVNGVNGVLAIAPYPGTLALQRQLARAGGPRAWRQTVPAPAPGGHLEPAMWWWLAGGAEPRRPPVYLGYGVDDRFADGLQMMSTTLPAAHASTVPGGHDWAPWRAVWNGWLERRLLPAC